MNRKLSETTIVQELAESVCKRLSRRAIRALQGLTDCRLSGDYSCLANIWDEICVQIQHEESFAWDAYEQTVQAIVAGDVEKLTLFERDAVWLQTPEGGDWDCEAEDQRESDPVYLDDIVSYVILDYVYAAAGNWKNPRIRQYTESCYLD
jgi:hypothetical protein